MNKIENVNKEELVDKYTELKSSYKVAQYFNVSATAVKRVLKNLGVLRTQKLAALERDNSFAGKYERTLETKEKLSVFRKSIKKENHPNFGKKHSEETKKKIGLASKKRLGKLNPNYKDGSYKRRPRDFKQSEFTKLRNSVFNRDNYTCKLTGKVGGHLHAHHLIPFWVCEEAFFDIDNLITVSTESHFQICHNGSWNTFNTELIPDTLLAKYNLDRERLNELASLHKKKMR